MQIAKIFNNRIESLDDLFFIGDVGDVCFCVASRFDTECNSLVQFFLIEVYLCQLGALGCEDLSH